MMIWEIIILVLGIPVGLLIAWLCKDELVDGRRWFRVLIILGILLGIWFYLIGFFPGAWSVGFVVVVSLVSLLKNK